MKSLSFSLNSSFGGGNITSFNYSHSLNELVGAWSAEVANGSFLAGQSFSINNVMQGGIISNAYKDSTGLWHLEGKDAGYRLMKSLPDIADLPSTNEARTLLNYIAGLAGISTSIDVNLEIGSLPEEAKFEVRCLLSGSTCAEAILELAMFCGSIAYINKHGSLVVAKPKQITNSHAFDNNIINDSGSSFDLDGYATHVVVQLSCLHKADDDDDDEEEVITDVQLPSKPYEEAFSGTFSDGNYRMTLLMPHGVVKSLQTTITKNGITHTTNESHEYDYRAKNLWRDNQEFGLYAIVERSYSIEHTTFGQYYTSNNKPLYFQEKTSETLERTMGGDNVTVGLPEDWANAGLNMPSKDIITRSTIRADVQNSTTNRPAGSEEDNMPAYAPEFDSRTTRNYSSRSKGKVLLCDELEEKYEARQIGSIAPVKKDDEPIKHFSLDSNLAIQTHSSPQWVLVKTFRSYMDQYDDEGQCVFSTQAEYSDDGSEWLVQNGLASTGDEKADKYQEAYARFPQQSQNMNSTFAYSSGNSVTQASAESSSESSDYPEGSPSDDPSTTPSTNSSQDSSIDPEEYQAAYNSFAQNSKGLRLSFGSASIDTVWQFAEIRGKSKSIMNKTAALGDISTWFDSGEYIKSVICPHYNPEAKSCNVFFFAGDKNDRKCSHAAGSGYWWLCERAEEALEHARKINVSPIDAPVIGTASISGNSSAVGYKRDVFINKELTPAHAQLIANLLAGNIRDVKSCKGLRKTISIPYDPNFQPDGDIVEVSHDWLNLQTSITYRFSDGQVSIPDFLISQSVASVAQFVAARQAARSSVPNYGVISKIYDAESSNETEKAKGKKGLLQVKINNKDIDCSSKLRGLQVDDVVVVAFPASSKLHGQIISKL